MFLQQLALLDGFDLEELSDAEYVHTVVECAKLAFADREAFYGDVDVPLERLLSREYNDERRLLVGEEASAELRPGGGRLPAPRAGRDGGRERASRRRVFEEGATPSTSTSQTASATSSRRRRAAAGCRARR